MKYFSERNDNIKNLIDGAMDKIKTIVDSSTVIGEKVVADNGTTIIPISKVTVGYVVGGGEYADLSSRRVANNYPMAGGSSGGMSLTPVGFLVLMADGEVKFVNVENKSLYQTVLNMFNTFLAKMQEDNKDMTNNDKEGEDEEI